MNLSVLKFLLIFALLLLSLAACSDEEDAPAPPTSTTSAELEPEGAVAPDVQESTIAKVLKRGHLVAGVKYDFKPFGFLDEGDKLVGFDVDLIQAMADEWGIKVEFAQVTSADRIPKLAAGEVDMLAASMTHKKEREEQIDFSQTYFLDGQSLLVRQESGITDIKGLDGKTVTAIEGSTSIEQIESYAAANNVTIELLPFLEYSPALEALKAGSVDALTTDSVALNQFSQDNPELIVVGGLFTEEPYGMGVPVGDSYFRNLVDFTLQKLKANGKYDELYTKWFGAATAYQIELMPGEWAYTFSGSPLDLLMPAQSIVDKIESEARRVRFLRNDTRTEDEEGRFVAGVKFDFAPFGFLEDNQDESGELVGFDVDIMKEFARRWVGDENAVEFVQVTSSDRIPKLAAGEVDIVAASMTHKWERDDTIDFSQTYFFDGQSLLVRAESGINGLADLDGKTVTAIEGSTSIDNIQAKASELAITIDMLPFLEYDAALEALKAGQVDALTTDSVALSQFSKEDSSLIVVGGRFTSEPYGLGVPNFDHRFRDLVNFTLQAMKEDGSYDRLYQKWFGNDTPYGVELWPGAADYLSVAYHKRGNGASGGSAATSDSLSKIERIRERGNLLVAGVKYDFKPFGFVDDKGQVVGFDVDLIQAMADQWGVNVEFVQVTSSDRIPKLAAGEVDMVAASMTHKKERDETIDFSQTYFLDGQSLLVSKESGIEGIEGLDGKTISAIAGSTSIDNIQAYADANDITIEILPFQEYPPAIEALKAGTVDALTTDSVALLQFSQDNAELAVVGGLFTEEPYGMGLPSGDSYFNNLVNFTLQDLKANGTYDELYQKWFGAEATPYNVEQMPGEWAYTFADSPTELDKPIQSKVEMILSQGGFTAGVKFDFAPFGFLEDNQDDGELVGFDVDIMKEFAKRWLGDEQAVEFVQVTSSDRIPKLAAREVDIVAASMTHKRERDETIDFSQTYFLDGQSLLVREESDIKKLADLDGKRVTAIQGSTSLENIEAKAEELGISIEIVPLLEYPPALEALKAGQVDSLTTDSVALSQFAKENAGLKVVGGRFTSEPYGIGLPNYDDGFRDLVNFTLQQMKIDGTYNRLYEKWFGNDTPYALEIWPGESYLNINTVPMLRIPAGDFTQGSNNGFSNEAPEQTVTLDEFYIDQYEITNFLYAKCVTAEECMPPKIERAISSVEYFSSPAFRTYPVIWVTWEDANTYCRFAGKRLPSEAEWEKAARGSEASTRPSEALTYPWGNQEPSPTEANFIGSGHIDTVPVGSYPAGVSPDGVHDMAGNVREWVNDWYARDYYQNAPTENPFGPSEGVTKVVRGGAWNEAAADLRTTRRKDFLPKSFDGGLGFRCASSTFPPTR